MNAAQRPSLPTAGAAEGASGVLAVVHAAEHESFGHPERPERIAAALAALERDGVMAAMRQLSFRAIEDEAIDRCHVPGYAAALSRACARGPGIIDPAPTYVNPSSWSAARRSAGAALAVVDAVLEGAPWGLSLARPPGHHAEPRRPMGFCLLANAALAARHAQARGVDKVLLVDFDVHHGNGSQAVFLEDASVLYASVHQAGIYPGTGAAHERGRGAGEGFTINVPLDYGAGDLELLAALDEEILPAAFDFAPDLVLVSAGYDGHERDPLAGLRYTAEGFHAATARLRELARERAEGRIALVLEGGYDTVGLGEGVVASVRALRGLDGVDARGAAGAEPVV
jgi:acetoin utilization deacetylase AcuC-like enzyme